jgi:hypothetical protein
LEVDWHHHYKNSNEQTNGAAAPPADGLGTADTPAIPKRDNPFELHELKSNIQSLVRNELARVNEQEQLEGLVRHVIKGTLQELMPSSFNSLSDEQQQQAMMTDPNSPPVDAMTPMEKAKLDREQEKTRRDALKQGEEELKVAKKEADFQKQKVDQSKRLKIPALTKRIQQLKGGV